MSDLSNSLSILQLMLASFSFSNTCKVISHISMNMDFSFENISAYLPFFIYAYWLIMYSLALASFHFYLQSRNVSMLSVHLLVNQSISFIYSRQVPFPVKTEVNFCDSGSSFYSLVLHWKVRLPPVSN